MHVAYGIYEIFGQPCMLCTAPLGQFCGFSFPGSFWSGSPPLKWSVINLNCDIFIMFKVTKQQGGWLVHWLSLCVKLTLSHNKVKNVLLLMQWKILILLPGTALSNANGQSLWWNNKNSNSDCQPPTIIMIEWWLESRLKVISPVGNIFPE